jgi:hypothetical protein
MCGGVCVHGQVYNRGGWTYINRATIHQPWEKTNSSSEIIADRTHAHYNVQVGPHLFHKQRPGKEKKKKNNDGRCNAITHNNNKHNTDPCMSVHMIQTCSDRPVATSDDK